MNDGDVDNDCQVMPVEDEGLDSSGIGLSDPQNGKQGLNMGLIFWKVTALVLTLTRRKSRMTFLAWVMVGTLLGGVMVDTVLDGGKSRSG